MSRERTRRPLLAAVSIGALAALLVWGWWASTDGYDCESVGVFDCMGRAIVMLTVGVPVAIVLAVLILRRCGAASGLLGTLAVFGAQWALVIVTEVLEPPMALWPIVTGLLAAAYVVAEGRLLARPAAERTGPDVGQP